jgi:hypothetical protein
VKLQIRFLDEGVGRRFYVLTDEAGNMLPGQMNVKINHGVSRLGVVTVEFGIDDKDVSLTREAAVKR